MTTYPEIKHDAAVQLANSTPAVTFVSLTIAGIPIQDWVALLGAFFILLQAGYLIWKWKRDARIEQERRDAAEERYVEDDL